MFDFRRRQIIAFLSGVGVTWSFAVHARLGERKRRIGVLWQYAADEPATGASLSAFRQVALKLDPLELRLRCYSDRDQHDGVAGSIVARVRRAFGPLPTRPRFWNVLPRTCTCRCYSRCGLVKGKVISCGCRGRPMTGPISGFANQRAGSAS
jgi:hypothetical protein